MVEEPMHEIPVEFWFREKQIAHDAKVAEDMAAELAAENQAFIEQQRIHLDNEAKTKALLDASDEERIKCDADIELSKKIKQE